MAKHIPCPNCFGTGKVGDPLTYGGMRPCQTCAGVGTVEVLKPVKRTNFDKVLEDNKEFLKNLIKRDCCVDPQNHKLIRCQPLSQCKYCVFGKDKGERFECDTDALAKWLDEEVKE